ncbi:hypothetical protein QR680_011729 [Steinernema hermaphroditum]|uniref:Uncharacterized protein n=1 Tax=Steinernema hermaphroditum TaxID=289476 RepID=A0AA39HZI1_9BILA|nr:hypothetical protein QR680_011729 [Steinernema hermaphroditum]
MSNHIILLLIFGSILTFSYAIKSQSSDFINEFIDVVQNLRIPELEKEMEDSCGSLQKLFSSTCFNFPRHNAMALVASALFGGDEVQVPRPQHKLEVYCEDQSGGKMADGLCKLAAGTSSLTHLKPEAYNDDDDYTSVHFITNFVATFQEDDFNQPKITKTFRIPEPDIVNVNHTFIKILIHGIVLRFNSRKPFRWDHPVTRSYQIQQMGPKAEAAPEEVPRTSSQSAPPPHKPIPQTARQPQLCRGLNAIHTPGSAPRPDWAYKRL